MLLIEKLTPEQEDLIPVIREKWRQIALSTEPINRQKVTQSVNAAYALIGEKEPKLLFFNSPYTALNTVVCLVLNKQLDYELGKEFKGKLENVLWTQLRTQLQSQLDDVLRKKLWVQLRHELWTNIGNQEREYQLGNRFYNHSMDNRRKKCRTEASVDSGDWLRKNSR